MKLNDPLLYKKKTLNKASFSILKTSKKESVVTDGVANLLGSKVNSGGAEEARTPDPLLAKQVLSQLSYSPTITT